MFGHAGTTSRLRVGRLRVAAGLYRPKPGQTLAEAAFSAGLAVEKSRKPMLE